MQNFYQWIQLREDSSSPNYWDQQIVSFIKSISSNFNGTLQITPYSIVITFPSNKYGGTSRITFLEKQGEIFAASSHADQLNRTQADREYIALNQVDEHLKKHLGVSATQADYQTIPYDLAQTIAQEFKGKTSSVQNGMKVTFQQNKFGKQSEIIVTSVMGEKRNVQILVFAQHETPEGPAKRKFITDKNYDINRLKIELEDHLRRWLGKTN